MEFYAPIISAIIIAIIGPLVIFFANKWYDSSESFSRALTEAVRVEFIISSMKTLLGAKRSFILNYHNGGQFYSGKDRQKVSMSHEKCNSDLRPIITRFQEVPISYFSSVAYNLNEAGELTTANIEEGVDGAYKELLKEHDVKTHHAFALYRKVVSFQGFFSSGTIFKERMVASVHFWFDKPREPMSIANSVEYDKHKGELQELMSK